MKKSFLFWIYFIIAIIFATYFSVRFIMTFLGHGNATMIKKVSISADINQKNLSGLGAVVGIAPGAKTFSVRLSDVHTRLSAVPDIKAAAVRRLPNGNLDIKLKMHKIVAVWTDGQNFYPVSKEGVIINRIIEYKPENSLMFIGKLPDNLSDIIKPLHAITNKIDFIERIENRRWNIITKNKIKILLPENDADTAINKLILMDKKNDLLSKNLELIDMRDSARILVK